MQLGASDCWYPLLPMDDLQVQVAQANAAHMPHWCSAVTCFVADVQVIPTSGAVHHGGYSGHRCSLFFGVVRLLLTAWHCQAAQRHCERMAQGIPSPQCNTSKCVLTQGGGNAQKTAMARQKAQEKAAKTAKGGSAYPDAASMHSCSM